MTTDDLLLREYEEATWEVIWVASPHRPRPGINRDASGNLIGFCGSPTQAHRADLVAALTLGEGEELQTLTNEWLEAENWTLLVLGRLLAGIEASATPTNDELKSGMQRKYSK